MKSCSGPPAKSFETSAMTFSRRSLLTTVGTVFAFLTATRRTHAEARLTPQWRIEWISHEWVRNPRKEVRPSGSLVRSESIRCSRQSPRPVRPGPASPSSPVPGRRGTLTRWADAHRRGGLRLGSAGGQPSRGGASRRRGLVPARGKALARCLADHGDDAHRHPGRARRQGRRLAGARERRAISSVILRLGQGLLKPSRACK